LTMSSKLLPAPPFYLSTKRRLTAAVLFYEQLVLSRIPRYFRTSMHWAVFYGVVSTGRFERFFEKPCGRRVFCFLFQTYPAWDSERPFNDDDDDHLPLITMCMHIHGLGRSAVSNKVLRAQQSMGRCVWKVNGITSHIHLLTLREVSNYTESYHPVTD
jgi:hypothetical protein